MTELVGLSLHPTGDLVSEIRAPRVQTMENRSTSWPGTGPQRKVPGMNFSFNEICANLFIESTDGGNLAWRN